MIKPAYEKNNIPIAYTADDNFLPCIAASVRSVMRNASPELNYDIILLHNDISEERLALFTGMADIMENISIRCFSASSCTEGYKFFFANRPDFSEAVYYRLCIPWLLTEYDKVIYLDGDTIIMADLARLFNTDIEEHLAAAAQDFCSQGSYFIPDGYLARYRSDVLKMSNPEYYFNSGVMIMNLAAFRNKFSINAVLETASSYEWQSHDQDVLNVLCDGDIKWLPLSWNYTEIMWNKEYLPEHYMKDYEEAGKSPRLYHFISDCKPWRIALPESHALFWEAAIGTPFFQEMYTCPKLYRYYVADDDLKDTIFDSFSNGEIGFRYILKYIRCWLIFKLKGSKFER